MSIQLRRLTLTAPRSTRGLRPCLGADQDFDYVLTVCDNAKAPRSTCGQTSAGPP
jgi:hypothetical protein